MATVLLVVGLGLAAGALTTLAGVGGGLLLTLALALVFDPHLALAIAAPALLLGNGHRVWMYRRFIDRRIALRIGGPAFAGALAGGVVVAGLGDLTLRAMLLLVAGLALVRQRLVPTARIGSAGQSAGGALVGVLTSTTGGGGLVLGPLTLGAGLHGPAFVATNSTIGVTVHVARLAAYGGAGMFVIDTLPLALLLAAAIGVGNLLASAARPRLGERICVGLTWGALGVGLALAAVGLAADAAAAAS